MSRNFLDKPFTDYGIIRIVSSNDGETSMTTVTPEEIEQYRSQLAADPDALKAILAADPDAPKAFDVLEECEGDLEYAAETIAIESGKLQDNAGDENPNDPSWLEKFAQKLHPHICTQAFREVLTQGFAGAVALLIPVAGSTTLLILVVVYISRKNLDEFCKDC